MYYVPVTLFGMNGTLWQKHQKKLVEFWGCSELRPEMRNEETATVICQHQNNFLGSEITSPFQTVIDKNKFISMSNEEMQTNFTYFNYMMKCEIRTPFNERPIYQMCHKYNSYIFIGLRLLHNILRSAHNARTE